MAKSAGSLTAAASLVAALALVGNAPSSPRSDSPRIVPWKAIGNVWLGSSRLRVEYVYGVRSVRPRKPPEVYYARYRLHGGELRVGYTGESVTYVNTTSPYYRTKSGLGVGTKIPLGRCHRTEARRCEYRWNGFTLDGSGLSGSRRCDTANAASGLGSGSGAAQCGMSGSGSARPRVTAAAPHHTPIWLSEGCFARSECGELDASRRRYLPGTCHGGPHVWAGQARIVRVWPRFVVRSRSAGLGLTPPATQTSAPTASV
ncbi:hypothetical protein BH18ACT13_BH18ACT13_12560 [soil metagenome]